MNALANARSIFADALDRPAPERGAFLDAACGGDDALRAEVLELLAADEEAGRFLGGRRAVRLGTATTPGVPNTDEPDGEPDTRAWDAPDPPAGPAGRAGTVLAGRYKLVEEIGEGGMGSVWLAHQTEPVKRLVAVKLIKAGMDSKAVLARFEAERQALALMDHPNIAKVFDAGTADGRPFFVMELVKGVPITRFCDERNLTPRERLALFVPVCQALQHAHQKGVIHRDVKPSNVLVALYDGRPVPKVIDFGIAKAAGAELTDRTLHTGFGLVGTPEYMAPEQAELNQLDVDTRADVYALGVLLYELLTGTPPFARADRPGGGLLDILKAVRETEPARPSARLSTSDALPALAARRGTDPRKLAGAVRGELDWIALKALAKDRERRYETANGLAKDVERYLAGEPVQAVPPSAAYRLRTLVRRNRGPVAATLGLVLALTVGLAGTAVGLVWAEDERVKAEWAQQDARGKARLAAEEQRRAEGEKRRADEEREVAEAVSRFVREDLLGRVNVEAADTFSPDRTTTFLAALDRAAARVGERFGDKPRVEAAIRRTLGETYTQTGEHEKAIIQLRRAVELLDPPPDAGPASKAVQAHADALRSLALAYQANREPHEAIAEFEKVLAAREAAFGPDAPETLGAVADLAAPYAALADGKTRGRLFRRIVEVRARTLGPDHPDTVWARYVLAESTADRKGMAAVVPALERARDERVRAGTPGHLDDAAVQVIGRLARVYLDLRRPAAAAPLFQQEYEAKLAKFGPNHVATWRVLLPLANAYAQSGQPEKSLREQVRLWEAQKKAFGLRNALTVQAGRHAALGYRGLGDYWEAIRLMEEILPGCREVYSPRETVPLVKELIGMLEKAEQFERAAELSAELAAACVPDTIPLPRPLW